MGCLRSLMEESRVRLVWYNATELDEENRALTLRFDSSVSGRPPTGAKVEEAATERPHRTLTLGGLMGATRATELYLGWKSCAGPATIDVHWPSGVSSSHTAPPGVRTTVAHEPQWWSLDPDAPGTVTLDPAAAGVEQGCVGSPQGQWTCCEAAESPCTITPTEAVGGAQQVKLTGQRAMAVPLGEHAGRSSRLRHLRAGEMTEEVLRYMRSRSLNL